MPYILVEPLKIISKNPFRGPTLQDKIVWSYSKLKLFRKCRRKFYWNSLLRLSPKAEPKVLVISNAGHYGLKLWYQQPKADMSKIASYIKKVTQERVEKVKVFYDQEEYDELIILLSTMKGMLLGYAATFESDKKKWIVSKEDVEQTFKIDMGTFFFKGRIDLLPMEGKRQLVVDHKIVSQFDNTYIECLPMDGQLRGYILGSTKGLNRPPQKVTYNLLRKCKLRLKKDESLKKFCDRIVEDYQDRPEFYYHRETLLFSKNDVTSFVYDMHKTHTEYLSLIRGNKHPLDPREWPCHDHMCREYFRACEFFPLCTQGLDKGTAKLYTQYNPKEEIETETDEV